MQIDGEFKDVALTQMRKTIARRLSESIGPVPTFYLTSEIDMTKVGQLREQMVVLPAFRDHARSPAGSRRCRCHHME